MVFQKKNLGRLFMFIYTRYGRKYLYIIKKPKRKLGGFFHYVGPYFDIKTLATSSSIYLVLAEGSKKVGPVWGRFLILGKIFELIRGEWIG